MNVLKRFVNGIKAMTPTQILKTQLNGQSLMTLGSGLAIPYFLALQNIPLAIFFTGVTILQIAGVVNTSQQLNAAIASKKLFAAQDINLKKILDDLEAKQHGIMEVEAEGKTATEQIGNIETQEKRE